ncbi:sugar porter family MFS transporter [Fulvivirgaceae bacterium PWU20]|uniref:Sugar porter family MFS transporter n=1 Tax=Chryseosolibacter indicus TaxID=2782351 RepID=A0ABS5VMB4_9BACT|nr:sugar porter family MFS transporter [Chryseosolibacter indicus]MBT1702516.1 sugar porter family MFS transporter [Chryseosolibacter indicus]
MQPNTAFRNAIVAALGGFLFGFDTAVISGVEKSIQQLWHLDDFWHGFTVASALVGTVIGSLVGGLPAERYGRKKVLQWIGLLYLVTSLFTALTTTWELFVLFRFLGGIGVGASSVVGPMYISEISPAHRRGRLVALFQFNIVTGILIAFLSNYLLFGVGEEAWRWMLGVQAIPSLLYFILVFFVPESPRWLIKHNRKIEAEKVLYSIGEPDAKAASLRIEDSLHSEAGLAKESLFNGQYNKPILFVVALAMFNQLSGINAIMYYAPRIFEMTGLAKDTALLQAVSIGVTNMIFTLLAISVIDRYGRKTLLIIGSFGMVISLGLVAWSFYTKDFGGYAVMFYLVAFIAFFAFSQGAVIWVFMSEIFPNSVRAKGQTLGSFTHWIMAVIISWAFPLIAESSDLGGFYSFLLFALMMFLHGVFVWRVLPETKGKSLEGIQQELHIH